MKRFMTLIGVAMLLTINTLSAQGLTVQNVEPKFKKREIAITYSDYEKSSISFRKFKKADTYNRLDINYSMSSLNSYTYQKGFGFSFGREKIVPITEKLSFYHGGNINYRSDFNRYDIPNNNDYASRTQTVSIGYRLGVRYDINKRFFIGAEINPQIGASTGQQYMQMGNSTHINGSKVSPFSSLGDAKIMVGMKF